MNGKIHFDNVTLLAEFLAAFCGSTATFQVNVRENGTAVLEFLGGF